MSDIEFLLVFSITPIGALIIAAVLLHVAKRDAEREDRKRSHLNR